jgi:hypothetical protein
MLGSRLDEESVQLVTFQLRMRHGQHAIHALACRQSNRGARNALQSVSRRNTNVTNNCIHMCTEDVNSQG